MFQQNREIWEFGYVTERLGSRHYLVKIDSGRIIKRHINQLCSTRVTHRDFKESHSQKHSNATYVTFDVPRLPSRSVEEELPEMPNNAPTPNRDQKPDLPILRRSERAKRQPVFLRDYEL
ncbi:hypothetical protein RN001_007053 [Aquatica leii]|uniref:Uncharacterized protein n=1 Tax=Aquatica leii TaxID=1421715 RepID=A0AAN7P7W0_9COLE|nr:hypothetical protein RN001_007053 [Aquatica leii]